MQLRVFEIVQRLCFGKIGRKPVNVYNAKYDKILVCISSRIWQYV